MKLHPLAWLAWLTAASVFAFAVTNPIYLGAAIGAVLLVHLAAPPGEGALARAVWVFLTVGAGLIVVRLVLAVFVADPGETHLIGLPSIELPTWLGSVTLGGPLTAEVLVLSVAEGLRFILVLVAFGVFNARVDLASTIRLVPPAFRDAGLIVSVAAAFVPGMFRTVRDVRDAQRLRGERGLRLLAPSLLVPILGLALERAFLLAESMDARGYGQGHPPARARFTRAGGLVALGGSVAFWLAGAPTIATLTAVAGGAALGWGIWSASRGSRTTRLAPPPWQPADTGVGVAAAAVAGLALLAGPDTDYAAYPALTPPPFAWPSALLALLLAAPIFREIASGPRPAAGSPRAQQVRG